MGKPCAQCGQDVAEGARACPRCGVAIVPQPTAAQTMIGFASPFAPPKKDAPPPAQPAPPAAAPEAPKPPMAQTMLGFAAPDLRVPPAASPQPAAPAPAPAGAKTMLGIAAPGIAPAASAPAPVPAPAPAAAPAPKAALGGTMLGVAMPGIAPLHSQPGVAPPPPAAQPAPTPVGARTMLLEQPPPIVPAPAPFVPEVAPSAPVVVVRRRGAPLAIVAVVASLLVLAGGAAILFFSHGSPPMTATAKVSADGKEQLHLSCEGCPDGTKATWKGASASFAHHEADLDLPAPLAIGDNAFEIALDRPGVGRDETVKLVLPLAYRIRGDLSGLAATPPVIRVDVEAQPGAAVTVDGKPVSLDASGKATLSYDVTADTAGAADETRTIERKIPYEVVGKDKKKSSGEVAVRVAVLPLHVDAPTAALVTDQPSVWVTGKTAKGASVTANGKSLTVEADGSFEGQVDVAEGDAPIAIRAAPAGDATAKAAPRVATITVSRVASLDASAKDLDKKATLDFDSLARDPSGAIGQSIAVSGSVVDARTTHHRAALLVDDKRGCAKGPCLIRVDYGGDLDVHSGDAISAWGAVSKPITASDGKTVPSVVASVVRKDKAKR